MNMAYKRTTKQADHTDNAASKRGSGSYKKNIDHTLTEREIRKDAKHIKNWWEWAEESPVDTDDINVEDISDESKS